MQRLAESGHIPLTPSEAQNANRNCFVYQQETETTDGSEEDSQGEGDPPLHDWQVYYIGWMPAALGGGGYK